MTCTNSARKERMQYDRLQPPGIREPHVIVHVHLVPFYQFRIIKVPDNGGSDN